jgi:hypothetical protein
MGGDKPRPYMNPFSHSIAHPVSSIEHPISSIKNQASPINKLNGIGRDGGRAVIISMVSGFAPYSRVRIAATAGIQLAP